MLETLMSKQMLPFVENISSFPTVIYTTLLLLSIVFWAAAVIGFLDLDILDLDLDLDGFDADGIDINNSNGSNTPDVLSGLLLRYGLVGVPVTVSLSLLILIGWVLCYYSVHFLFPFEKGSLMHYVAGLPTFLATLYLAAKATGYAIKPLKPLFAKANQQTEKKVLGQTAIVRTSRVDNDFGEATLDDGGAGLIIKVRTRGEDRFVKGDKVILFEKLNNDNVYRVISEAEFIGN